MTGNQAGRIEKLERTRKPEGALYVIVGMSPGGTKQYLSSYTGKVTSSKPAGKLFQVFVEVDLTEI